LLSPELRRVVLDEDIGWKLMQQLRGRGRADATAVIPEGLRELKDGALVKRLAHDYEPFVLVTWDNKMPVAHREALEHHGTTLAVVDQAWFRRNAQSDSEQQRYIHDVVHRWLHRIETLAPGERRFYSPTGTRKAA
jgi:hypothetical protein